MEGFKEADTRGIIPRSVEEIFEHIQNSAGDRHKFLVRASYLQIYNEVISDLLKPDRASLQIRESPKRGVFVEGLSEWVVRSPQEVYNLIERGSMQRATGATRMNELSSRSHAVFIVICEQSEIVVDDNGEEREVFRIGKLNLVDLAGSERVRDSGATGQRLEETRNINQSLSALGNVISALIDTKPRIHIPYRDSKLTRILEDSLGGNCVTQFMAMVTPVMASLNETLSTLKFANRAKNIRNDAHVNEDMDQKALIRKYEREIRKLRTELETKSRAVIDKERMLALEEQKKRAEMDKLTAIRALEARSREFLQQKQSKRKLEEKIQKMQSSLLLGGREIVNDEDFGDLVAQYNDRMATLERERQTVEEDKANIVQYKTLLLKQRDIMIALTGRLSERDSTIKALQEELDAFDRHQCILTEKLDLKDGAINALQQMALDADIIKEAVIDPHGHVTSDFMPLIQQHLPHGVLYSSPGRAEQMGSLSTQISDVGSDADDLELLDADQKIQELRTIIDTRDREIDELHADLDTVEDERSRLEMLLRDRLEQLVTEEVGVRIKEIRPSKGAPPSSAVWDRMDVQTEERRALKSIMEGKISPMVANSIRIIEHMEPSTAAADQTRVYRQLVTLKRLVDASVGALTNAEEEEAEWARENREDVP